MKRLFNVYINSSPHSDGLFSKEISLRQNSALYYCGLNLFMVAILLYEYDTIFFLLSLLYQKQSFVNACLFYLFLIGNVQTTLHYLTVFDEVKTE